MKQSYQDIIAIGRKTIKIEADAIKALESNIDSNFAISVEKILESQGRVILTGVGKSAIIAQKIAATLNSTGTPALFMHAADAIHGDLGMIGKDDILICLSKSGETSEIKVLLPLLRNFGNLIIAITAAPDSYLAKEASLLLLTPISKEADPNNLAPTTSSTAQLVMGDALAVALLASRGFSPGDFARFHPGGSLGKRLYLRASDLLGPDSAPQVLVQSSISDVIMEISSKRLGATAVLTSKGLLKGIITDGDLRRMLGSGKDMSHLKAIDIMNTQPKEIAPDALAVNALELMRENNISQLLVVEKEKYLGIIHLHELIREGLL